MATGKLLRKLAPRTIMGGKPNKPEKETHLFNILGRATKVQRGESNFGPWSALVGQFEAVRADTGEVFYGPKAFLPEPMHSMIVEQVESGEVSEAEFSIKVSIIPSDTSVGYEYVATPLVEVRESDALSHLREAARLDAPKNKGGKKDTKAA